VQLNRSQCGKRACAFSSASVLCVWPGGNTNAGPVVVSRAGGQTPGPGPGPPVGPSPCRRRPSPSPVAVAVARRPRVARRRPSAVGSRHCRLSDRGHRGPGPVVRCRDPEVRGRTWPGQSPPLPVCRTWCARMAHTSGICPNTRGPQFAQPNPTNSFGCATYQWRLTGRGQVPGSLSEEEGASPRRNLVRS
jgi:hypothetical protein